MAWHGITYYRYLRVSPSPQPEPSRERALTPKPDLTMLETSPPQYCTYPILLVRADRSGATCLEGTGKIAGASESLALASHAVVLPRLVAVAVQYYPPKLPASVSESIGSGRSGALGVERYQSVLSGAYCTRRRLRIVHVRDHVIMNRASRSLSGYAARFVVLPTDGGGGGTVSTVPPPCAVGVGVETQRRS